MAGSEGEGTVHGGGKEGILRKVPPQVLCHFVVYAMLFLSFLVFSQSAVNEMISKGFSSLLAFVGIDLGTELFLFLAVLVLVLRGLLNERKLRSALVASWIMFVPAVLPYSGIDWLAFFGFPSDLLAIQDAPPLLVLANGVGLVAAGILLRARLQTLTIEGNLERRGAPKGEVRGAIWGMLLHASWVIILSALLALLVGAVVLFLAPYLEAALVGLGQGLTVLALVAGAALLLILLVYLQGIKAEKKEG